MKKMFFRRFVTTIILTFMYSGFYFGTTVLLQQLILAFEVDKSFTWKSKLSMK